MKTRKLTSVQVEALTRLALVPAGTPIDIELANSLGIRRCTLRALYRRYFLDVNIEWPSIWTLTDVLDVIDP